MSLSQSPREKTREEYLQDTIEERMALSAAAVQIVAAELGKRSVALEKMSVADKANLVAYAIQLVYAITDGVVEENIRRFGE